MARLSPRSKKAQKSLTEIDAYVGRRIRERRLLLGASQEQRAADIGLIFQQIQKYERGFNRVSASRLFRLTHVLDVPIARFYDGISAPSRDDLAADDISKLLSDSATLRFIKAHYGIKDATVHRQVREIASIMADEK